MVTLNNIVKDLVEDEWREVTIDHGSYLSSKLVDTELILDSSIPEIHPETPNSHPLLSLYYRSIFDALGELFREVSTHTESTKRRVKIGLIKDKQILELAWDGKQLSEQDLRLINDGYLEGMSLGELPYHSGTRRAGYFLNQVGGEVMIENFHDGIYVVRNVIKLPIKT
ncbi:MAG: hypothetical protein Q8R04_05330 [Nanoarchaeota archaeon]|nr:hypothetical protein [Nanoarchaeota archaeon]